MEKYDNPLEWYEKKICSKCKNKACQTSGGGVYRTDWNAKLACILSAVIMLELDRAGFKQLVRRGKNE